MHIFSFYFYVKLEGNSEYILGMSSQYREDKLSFPCAVRSIGSANLVQKRLGAPVTMVNQFSFVISHKISITRRGTCVRLNDLIVAFIRGIFSAIVRASSIIGERNQANETKRITQLYYYKAAGNKSEHQRPFS